MWTLPLHTKLHITRHFAAYRFASVSFSINTFCAFKFLFSYPVSVRPASKSTPPRSILPEIQKADLELAKRFFTRKEYDFIAGQQGSGRKDEMFFRLWTRKKKSHLPVPLYPSSTELPRSAPPVSSFQLKIEAKEEPKKEPKKEPKEEPKEEAKKEAKEEPKKEPKEEAKEEPKKEPKKELKKEREQEG